MLTLASIRNLSPNVGEDLKKRKGLYHKSELISENQTEEGLGLERPDFYLKQNGKPFHEEFNLVKSPCRPQNSFAG